MDDLELDTLPMPNFLELAFYMHQASTGFSTDELFRIGLSVKKLIGTEPLRRVRLWGKIFGSDKNYIVIEGDWQEGEGLEEDLIESSFDPFHFACGEPRKFFLRLLLKATSRKSRKTGKKPKII